MWIEGSSTMLSLSHNIYCLSSSIDIYSSIFYYYVFRWLFVTCFPLYNHESKNNKEKKKDWYKEKGKLK